METFEEYCGRIAASLTKTDYSANQTAALELPATAVRAWTPGETYHKGELCHHNGIKYMILTAGGVTAQEHQPPDMPNGAMLSVYVPYRDEGRYPWLYGEYCVKGYQRSYNGEWYEVIQANAGANTYPPNQAASVWKKLSA